MTRVNSDCHAPAHLLTAGANMVKLRNIGIAFVAAFSVVVLPLAAIPANAATGHAHVATRSIHGGAHAAHNPRRPSGEMPWCC
jgi:hypothetical protein